jgi:hypothetical protein
MPVHLFAMRNRDAPPKMWLCIMVQLVQDVRYTMIPICNVNMDVIEQIKLMGDRNLMPVWLAGNRRAASDWTNYRIVDVNMIRDTKSIDDKRLSDSKLLYEVIMKQRIIEGTDDRIIKFALAIDPK